MKTNMISVSLFILILGLSFKVAAQPVKHVTIYGVYSNGLNTVNLPVQTNQIISLIGYDWQSWPPLSGNMPDGTVINLTPFKGFSNASTAFSQVPQVFTGLTNITLKPSGWENTSWATFQITTPADANIVSNSYVPANAVVIPTSATGNVEIIMESSTDLVNWTSANPGTYGASSATNRFFRVRAVHN